MQIIQIISTQLANFISLFNKYNVNKDSNKITYHQYQVIQKTGGPMLMTEGPLYYPGRNRVGH